MTHHLRHSQEILVKAAKAFHEHTMPLSACLDLQRHLSNRGTVSDVLAPTPEQTRGWGDALGHAQLQSMLKGVRLGEWALDIDTIGFIYDQICLQQPKGILEFGSGVSTIVLARAMADLHGKSSSPVVLSLEQDVTQVQATVFQLEKHRLAEYVKVLHAPLAPQTIHHMSTNCYLIPLPEFRTFLDSMHIEFVLIDGPAAGFGERVGTLPLVQEFLEPGAMVYMDDALRDSELAIADWWSHYGYLNVEGVLWKGKGVLVGKASVRPISQGSQAREFLTWLERESQCEPFGPIWSPPTQFPEVQGATSKKGAILPDKDLPKEGRPSFPADRRGHRCLFLNTYYPGFLDAHYARVPGLALMTYQIQKESLQAECFGDSDFYSEALKENGWEAHDLIVNCASLQDAWALENNNAGRGLEVVIEQIKWFAPDVIYLQDLSLATPDFVSAIRPLTKLIVGQIASNVPPRIDLKVFNILFSSFPHFVREFRAMGIPAYYQPLAFDPRVLSHPKPPRKKHDVTFVGTLSADHSRRMEFLEQLQAQVEFDCWGYQLTPLPHGSRMKQHFRGEAWGKEMFHLLQESSITLNYHVDAAGDFANNMRLFEATGCGALLITDYKDNLQELFHIGREVVVYRSLEECADLVRFYLQHQEEAQRIAKAGQTRTFRDHTYKLRMAQTAEILGRHLRNQKEASRFGSPDLSRISYGYQAIGKSQVTVSMINAWKNQEIPFKQRALVRTELQAMYSGKPPLPFQVLADCLRPHMRPHSTLLEIGCASGYYYEVLEYLLGKRLAYTGVDYSEPLIAMAKDYYPSASFQIADGGTLPFDDSQFHIAVSACILLHVPDYREHIRETARVAQHYVVAHRTPVCKQSRTQVFKKYAYGIETVELRFNEKEFLAEFFEVGLTSVHAVEYVSVPDSDQYDVTYVFKKNP